MNQHWSLHGPADFHGVCQNEAHKETIDTLAYVAMVQAKQSGGEKACRFG